MNNIENKYTKTIIENKKNNWPWTESLRPKGPKTLSSVGWPKISIVTPSYNQGRYLEETIRSVILQGYPNLEYIIMDGGSTDNSVEIIKKYEPWLAYWESGKDNGQADAIKRGFKRATGEIFAYINSDDYYCKDVFDDVARRFMRDRSMDLLIGSGRQIDEAGRVIRRFYGYPQDFNSILHLGRLNFNQPSAFWRSRAYFDAGEMDGALKFCMDADLFLRLTRNKTPGYTYRYYSVFRWHDQSKSSTIKETALSERKVLFKKYAPESDPALFNSPALVKQLLDEYEPYEKRGMIFNFFSEPHVVLNILKRKIFGSPKVEDSK
jgi:glycosyltransferase involved in cell wall biosynthesis